MRRRLLFLCSALSLPLFIATCLLWVRSYFALEQVGLAVLRPSADKAVAFPPPAVWSDSPNGGLEPDRWITYFDFRDYYGSN